MVSGSSCHHKKTIVSWWETTLTTVRGSSCHDKKTIVSWWETTLTTVRGSSYHDKKTIVLWWETTLTTVRGSSYHDKKTIVLWWEMVLRWLAGLPVTTRLRTRRDDAGVLSVQELLTIMVFDDSHDDVNRVVAIRKTLLVAAGTVSSRGRLAR